MRLFRRLLWLLPLLLHLLLYVLLLLLLLMMLLLLLLQAGHWPLPSWWGACGRLRSGGPRSLPAGIGV